MNRTRILLFLVMSTSCLAQSPATWSQVRPGIEMQQGSLGARGEDSVGYVLFRVDPVRIRIRVIDAYHEIGKANSYAAFSIRQIREKTGASLVVNAGSTWSFSIPAPVGLLKVNGKVVSRPNYAQDAGVLCFTAGRVSIVSLSKDKRLECSEAVQRGPLLSSQIAPSAAGERPYNRTIAAVDSKGRLIILVTKEPATLWAIKTFLYDSRRNLTVVSALNMDADVSSGVIYSMSRKMLTVGNVDGLVASALAIYY